jgi:hypothetical protein
VSKLPHPVSMDPKKRFWVQALSHPTQPVPFHVVASAFMSSVNENGSLHHRLECGALAPVSRLDSQHTASHIAQHFACIVLRGSLENELSIFPMHTFSMACFMEALALALSSHCISLPLLRSVAPMLGITNILCLNGPTTCDFSFPR